nr:CCA tRNA nucleotidyltransferase [Anaerolineae bacterium]
MHNQPDLQLSFDWPDMVNAIANNLSDPSRTYLVGGMVRDAVVRRQSHDIDLVTTGDGLQIARELADTLEGAYYPLDKDRRTGRVIFPDQTLLDIASIRGPDLEADLRARDFTINAMAVRLDQLDRLIDPLNGLEDLLKSKTLRQCSPASIETDPVRAIRAVRIAQQFGLRMAPDTIHAIRQNARNLLDLEGSLRQPERVRDAFFGLLEGPDPAGGLRACQRLGLLEVIYPYSIPAEADIARQITAVEILHKLLTIVTPRRNDNDAADLTFGVVVMTLDTFRKELGNHFSRVFANGRSLEALALLAVFSGSSIPHNSIAWARHLHLSDAERAMLADSVESTRRLAEEAPENRRQFHRYYRLFGENGITGIFIYLAELLSKHPLAELDHRRWGDLLDGSIHPLLEAYYRMYAVIVSPPPLLTGHDLIEHFALKPGPLVGSVLEAVLEAQAAGEITTKKEALKLAERLLTAE